MRTVGRRCDPPIQACASADALQRGLAIVDAAATFGWTPSTGQRKGVYPGMIRERRRLLLGAAAALAGCGFQLRQTPPLPMRSIALVGFGRASPLAVALKGELERAGVSVRDNPAQAETVFDALGDAREKTVAASTAAGQVREVQLRVRLRFRVASPAGRLLLPPSDLLLTRDMSYNETAALAKQQEELLLYRAMEDDIVAQVLRRLSVIQLG
jgi:LPS-assembly lipoprotein